MKNKLLIFFILSFSVYASNAQRVTAGYSVGYGTYLMRDMKDAQETALNLANRYLDNVASTETFSGWIFQNAFVGLLFNDIHEAGMRYDYFTTSGRNHLADYSGEYQDDIYLKGNAVGLYYKIHYIRVPMGKNFSFKTNFSLSGGLIFNNFEEEASLVVYEFPDSNTFETINASSINGYILPAIGFQFWYSQFIYLNLNVGYQFDIQGGLKFSAGKSDYGINWSGLRASAGIGFSIPIINHKN